MNGNELTVNELLSAISQNEYPQYILDAIERVRLWIRDSLNDPDNSNYDPLAAMFENDFDEGGNLSDLVFRMSDLEESVDILPNVKAPEGKPDTIVMSITPPDYESGIRTAIDYAAVFNRLKSKRVWIFSNAFILEDIIKYSHHVDALADQGISLRFILITPWGWVELPMSGAMVSKYQFTWQTKLERQNQTRKRKTKGRNEN